MRWLIIGGFGFYGVYVLVEGILDLTRQHHLHWAGRWLFAAPLIAVASGMFLTISYCTLVRQYRRLCTLLAVLAAVAAFSCIFSVPEWLGVEGWMDSRSDGVLLVAGIFINIAAFVAGWYGARWVFRRGQALLQRYVLHEPHTSV